MLLSISIMLNQHLSDIIVYRNQFEVLPVCKCLFILKVICYFWWMKDSFSVSLSLLGVMGFFRCHEQRKKPIDICLQLGQLSTVLLLYVFYQHCLPVCPHRFSSFSVSYFDNVSNSHSSYFEDFSHGLIFVCCASKDSSEIALQSS